MITNEVTNEMSIQGIVDQIIKDSVDNPNLGDTELTPVIIAIEFYTRLFKIVPELANPSLGPVAALTIGILLANTPHVAGAVLETIALNPQTMNHLRVITNIMVKVYDEAASR